ncbi:unnamed protein product [Mytilus coruscus]|uniref:Novel STAND NTPase 3 domain-containing protein n=1 Tax=Mytilus coruscus TaxID=42192 RepID=A0A6J8BX11_MYTCO|nr:unnamed protein product [Mytilus coruscus]
MDEEPSTSCGIKRSIPKELQDEVDVIAAKLPRDIVKSADLSDNQKRWLVVGICLHSVIAPALRNYVVQILTSFYNQLSCHHKIDTQIYPNHLQRYQPTNTYLNYEIINNNKAKHGYKKANYDYTIKNAVDLSKLFLQTHMAHYTGFDETCDSSALLGLIINIDQFTPVVKSDAEDVRRDIRNPWAHCDYTKWDALKYSTSFQLMEKLVMDLNMSHADKNQIMGELNKWKLNGRSFLNGSTLGLELVNEISQQTQVLAEYTKQVARKTDDNLLRIKKELDNFGRIFQNEKVQFKKDTRRGFLEIQRKLMDQDKTLKNHETQFEEIRESLSLSECRDSHIVEIDLWKEESEMFVETPAVNMISQILESKHCILIVGESGIGKSFLVHHVALNLHNKMKYNIIPCSGIRDIFQHYKEDSRQMFVLDDICGKYTTSLSDAQYLIKNEHILKRMLKRGVIKILATCRLDIYSEEMFKESCTFFASNIFNLSAKYSKDDILTICSRYLTEANIQLLKHQNVQFTPLMCSLYSNSQNFNLSDFLQSPFETYQMEWNKLKSIDPHKYCALFLCVIFNGFIKESLFDIYNENNTENKYVIENVYEICGINRGTSRSKIKRVLDSLVGTYLRKTGNNYIVIHDQMFDFMCGYFGKKDEMVTGILRYSDIRVINERTQLESLKEQHGKFTIIISKKYELEYFERIKHELKNGKMNQCFCNSQMKFEKYRALFLKMIKSIDDSLLMEYINKRNNRQYEFTCNKDDLVATEEYEYQDYSDDEDMTEGPFISSCIGGYNDIVQYFVSKGADITLSGLFNSPLTAACIGGNEKIVQLLIEKGSEKNQTCRLGFTPLTVACTEGNEKIVQLLIDKGCDVNQADDIKRTPLTAACWGGNENIVQLLIDKGCGVNQDGFAETPLTAACKRGYEKIVNLLINKGGNVNLVDTTGETPLTAACRGDNEKIVHLLIDNKVDVNQADSFKDTPLIVTCSLGKSEKIVQLLINQGVNLNQTDSIGQNSLTAACTGGNEKIVQLLIDKGVNVNMIDKLGQTPLTAACSRGHDKVVQLLLDQRADINNPLDLIKTPLIAACIGGHANTVELLLHQGYDLQRANVSPFTPLTAACWGQNENIFQLLIERGLDINQADGFGETPLMTACERGSYEILQMLIDKGVHIDQSTEEGLTPITATCGAGSEKAVKLLVDMGVDIDDADFMGPTPLIAACSVENANIVQLLIDKRCDVNQTDYIGRETPLIVACMRENKNIVKLLIDNGADVNQASEMDSRETPLMIALSRGNRMITQLLKDKGAEFVNS